MKGSAYRRPLLQVLREDQRLLLGIPIILIVGFLIGRAPGGQPAAVVLDDRPSPPTQHRRQAAVAEAEVDNGEFWIEKILDSPRVFVLHNVVTPQEAGTLMDLGARKGMSAALITPYGSNQLVPSSTRTNTAAWLDFQQDELVARYERKLAEATGTKPEDGENLQILHYANGDQYFQEHRDYFDPKEDPEENFAQGGNRMVTAILYLKTPEQGGETYFTKLDLPIKVKPGDAIVFWNLDREGQVDPLTYHSALPPRVGEKWVAVKWIHEREYQAKQAGPPVKGKRIELMSKPVPAAAR